MKKGRIRMSAYTPRYQRVRLLLPNPYNRLLHTSVGCSPVKVSAVHHHVDNRCDKKRYRQTDGYVEE